MTMISRRDVFRIACVSLASGGTVAATEAQPATVNGIEPIAFKRRGVGFRGIDKARAFPGFTLPFAMRSL